ncbi:glucose-6-phosphate dehydrogenase [soil metagenome]
MDNMDNMKISPSIMVIFGASGDLTQRMLIPSLYRLFLRDLLPKEFQILGFARTEMNDDEFRDFLKKAVSGNKMFTDLDENKWNEFAKKLSYLTSDFDNPDSYHKLARRIEELDANTKACDNRLLYFAIPPSTYKKAIDNLGISGLNVPCSEDSWTRIIIEKPFGHDLASAKELNAHIAKYFSEYQIYRIDHYQGKETVQNILVTRFSNGIFEPIWNRNYIHHVEITAAESIGIENRGGYYDNAGALRDMVQNHLLQLTCLVAMEPPSSFRSNFIRNETMKVLQSLRPMKVEDVPKRVIRGQYTESVIKGEHVKGYRQEKDVAPRSKTETFIALKLFIDNWRWEGVPFYLRTGKRLPTRVSEIVIRFKPTPHTLFALGEDISQTSNQLILRIQPDEGILLKFGMKEPGEGFKLHNVGMDFHYTDLHFAEIPTAYERLILDCMMGDSTLFVRQDAVEACWEFVQPIIDAFENNKKIPVHGYPAGSWGPKNADELLNEKDMTWRYPCKNLTNDDSYCEL